MKGYVMALDQGTSSSRAIIFDESGTKIASAQHEFPQIYPKPGWVEHDPFTILETTYISMTEALEKSGLKASDISGIGITNQRETTVVWDRHTGKPVYNAIVWQCRRTADICETIKAENAESYIHEKTGLIVDAYFSGTKIKWILDNVEGALTLAEKGDLIFGNIDTWLIWNLTGAHTSDYSNCSRTMLFDINRKAWDSEIAELLGIPSSMLPEPKTSSEIYGRVKKSVRGLEAFEGIPVCGSCGDQPSALLGQACILPGQAKNTYGTGCFTLMNTGSSSVRSRSGLLTSVAWEINGSTSYAVEGSVFNAGTGIQWMRDELRMIESAPEIDRLAESVEDNGGAYFVSAFTGLGAPFWNMYARGTMTGITRGTTRAHFARAVLEGIAYQVKALLDAMDSDSESPISVLRVDGGTSVSNFLMQFQSDILRIQIDRPSNVETTAFGAAFLAGLSAGIWSDIHDIEEIRKSDRIFTPVMNEETAAAYYEKWTRAAQRALDWEIQ